MALVVKAVLGSSFEWLWVKTNDIPFWLVGEFTTHVGPILVVGLSPVHCRYDLDFDHGQVATNTTDVSGGARMFLCGRHAMESKREARAVLRRAPKQLGRALGCAWRCVAGWMLVQKTIRVHFQNCFCGLLVRVLFWSGCLFA